MRLYFGLFRAGPGSPSPSHPSPGRKPAHNPLKTAKKPRDRPNCVLVVSHHASWAQETILSHPRRAQYGLPRKSKFLSIGAIGYLLKTSSVTEITQAVRDALAGRLPMTSHIARRVLDMFAKLAPKHSDYGLSEREKEILQLMTTGFIKKEIADRLTLSVHTVDTYLRRIYEKLEVNTRTGAVAKALKEGLV